MADAGPPDARARGLTDRDRSFVADARDMVQRLARTIARTHDGDAEDLFQIGMEIACQLAPRFDFTAGATFGTFIYARARGAMLDACSGERQRRDLARALQRGAQSVLASTQPQSLEEILRTNDAEGAALLAERIDALAAAAVLGALAAASTPEDLRADAQERARLRADLDARLAKLDPIDRELVVRASVGDQGLAEIARALGLEYDKARYRYTKALAAVGRGLPG
jgi:RNA polymerase sigma factor for flagellar operon FliA